MLGTSTSTTIKQAAQTAASTPQFVLIRVHSLAAPTCHAEQNALVATALCRRIRNVAWDASTRLRSLRRGRRSEAATTLPASTT